MKPLCSKHNLPMINSLRYGMSCPKCRQEIFDMIAKWDKSNARTD